MLVLVKWPAPFFSAALSGSRTYEVTSVSKVSETDRSALAASQSNVITLYTCVRDERDLGSSGFPDCRPSSRDHL